MEVENKLAQKINRLYSSGKSLIEIAKEIGVAQPVVRRLVRKTGGAVRSVGRVPLFDEATSRLIAVDYSLGKTLKDLSKKYGSSTMAVRTALGRLGAKLRVGGPFRKTIDLAVVREMLADRKSWPAICEKFGVSDKLIRRQLRKAGYDSLLPKSETTAKEIMKSYASGKTLRELSVQYKKSVFCVKHAVLRHGGKLRESDLPKKPSWRYHNPTGYISVKIFPTDAFYCMANSNGLVYEHRLKMAQYLERPLKSWESVHHKDRDRTNNAITNLQLRIGMHGSGVVYRCKDCLSYRIQPDNLAEGVRRASR